MRGERHSARDAAFAIVAALAFLFVPAAVPRAVAAEELRLTVAATYTLDPEDGAVHVLMDVTATNLKPNTRRGDIITSYYYNRLSFGIQAEATALRATSGGRRLSATATPRDSYKVLNLRLASNLDYRETQRIRITFDLPAGAPRSDSDIRVGEAFSSFYAWAWGDPGRSSIAIVIPAGFEESVNGATLKRVANSTQIRLTADAIADPDTWFVTVDAARPDKLTRDRVAIPGGAHLVIRAWPEDAEWRTKVHDLIERGLPKLQENIGLDWPVDGDVDVVEVHTPLLEGYAGVYYTESDRIEIGEDLDDLTILHEASHAWFNGDLFDHRWINEGLADEYASIVLAALGEASGYPDAVTPRSPDAVPLNDWEHPGRIDDEETDRRETYGYNASWTLLRALVADVGIDGMRKIFRAAEEDQIAYRGEPAPERYAGSDDWRRFLDLLEEVGGSTEAERLFRLWVVESHQVPLLDDRAAARKAYAALLESADTWAAPYAIRAKLSGWDFDRAETAIDDAERVIAAREAIEARTAALGISPTGALETAYESAKSDLAAAQDLAEKQVATLDELAEARAALDAERDIFTSVGLVGNEPDAAWASALGAFRADRLDDATAAAADVEARIGGAAELGRTRVVGAVGATGAGLLLGGGLVVVARRRRRGDAVPPSVVGSGPYATLPPPPSGARERGDDFK
jgi:hypothetical protein